MYPFNRDAVPEEKFDPVSLRRFKEFKTPGKEIPTLKELTLQKVLHLLNMSSQVPEMHTHTTQNEENKENIDSNKTSRPQLTLSAVSSEMPLQSQGMGFSNLSDTNTPSTSKITIIEDRILSESEKVSFETLLLQKIKRSDCTVKLKRTKISKGCEVIIREEFLEKKKI